jgi:signal transduction histidine kinase
MVGQPRRAYVLAEDRHLFDEERARWEKGEVISIVALRHQGKDGRLRWLSVHSRGIFDENGRTVGRRGVARDVTQQVLAERRVRELSHRLINAQEEERKRVALDLHDEMGQLLSALKIGLQSLAEHVGSEDAGELAKLIRLSQKIMDRIRALAYHLRPAILDNFGLVAAVDDLCESLAESGMVEVEQSLEEVEEKALSPEVKTALFRFVQESLTNVVKHAESPRAQVMLTCAGGELTMQVRDWGRGFNAEQALAGVAGDKHLGLMGMSERISLVGGTLEIASAPGQGSTLTARLSLPACASPKA